MKTTRTRCSPHANLCKIFGGEFAPRNLVCLTPPSSGRSRGLDNTACETPRKSVNPRVAAAALRHSIAQVNYQHALSASQLAILRYLEGAPSALSLLPRSISFFEDLELLVALKLIEPSGSGMVLTELGRGYLALLTQGRGPCRA